MISFTISLTPVSLPVRCGFLSKKRLAAGENGSKTSPATVGAGKPERKTGIGA
ncbi:MAG: hypothetical protein E6X17_00960 [Sporomusaceae bacterium]|nr:hypothetical protein [Sporomusaceae bacterium]